MLSDRGRAALLRLMEHDARVGAQPHVYGNWPAPGTDDGGKRRLAEQVSVCVFVVVVVLLYRVASVFVCVFVLKSFLILFMLMLFVSFFCPFRVLLYCVFAY